MATKNTSNKFGNALDDWFSEEKNQEVKKSGNKNTEISENKQATNSRSQNPQISKSQEISISETKQIEKSENIQKKENPKPRSSKLSKSVSKKTRMSGNLVLRPKTFDLPPKLITRIKIEAAQTGKKEYQIALEAFEKFFKEGFEE